MWDYVFAGKHFVFVGTFQNFFRLLKPLSIYIVQLFTLDQSFATDTNAFFDITWKKNLHFLVVENMSKTSWLP